MGIDLVGTVAVNSNPYNFCQVPHWIQKCALARCNSFHRYAPMGPEDSIAVGTVIEAGEDIEVRLMADQASSNEDVGITHLKMTLRHDQT